MHGVIRAALGSPSLLKMTTRAVLGPDFVALTDGGAEE